MTKKKKLAPLIPADPKQCQAEITTYRPFVMGGKVRDTQRCLKPPIVIATEKRPGKDGRKGSMSLCAECKAEFEKQLPGAATYKPVTHAS